jgi:hypothetical protein
MHLFFLPHVQEERKKIFVIWPFREYLAPSRHPQSGWVIYFTLRMLLTKNGNKWPCSFQEVKNVNWPKTMTEEAQKSNT